ncbi:MAG: T9SS type A sorting domain-containing protein, partial [bacterium]
LSQNYPNPFNPSTTINFDMPIEGFVSLKIFNSSGKEVATLLNESRTSGYHSVNFDASNLSSGIYYYKLETNNFSKVMKMAFVK